MPTKRPPAMPQTFDLSVYQGTSLVVEIEVDIGVSIQNATITMRVKRVEADADVDQVFFKKTGGLGIVITQNGDATTPGKFEVRIDPGDTQNLFPQDYVYDIKMMMGADVHVIVERSHFSVEPTVTISV